MFKKIFLTAALVMSANVNFAAEVSRTGEDRSGSTVIRLSGDIEANDVERFAAAIDGINDAIILLESNGGNLQAGLDIGSRIRLMGFATGVSDGKSCYSSCAIAWLGGTKRYVGTDAHVSFHAAYVLKNGAPEESGVANALVGAYFSKLGLSQEAVIFLTSAPPDNFNELDASWANELGIEVQFGSTAGILDVAAKSEKTDQDPYGIRNLSAQQVSYIEEIANKGDANAQMTMGLLYATGKNDRVSKDYGKSMVWFERAADQGLPEAQFALSVNYRHGNGVAVDSYRAIVLLKKSAKQGYKRAQKDLVIIYRSGKIAPKNDAEANMWLLKLTESGDPWAQYEIGRSFLYGLGVAVDEKQAAKYFLMAAEQGDANAQYAIASCYNNAQGVPIDYDQAFSWMKKAAEGGLSDAQYSLSVMYERGAGVAKSDSLAAKWMSSAAVNGDVLANYFVALNFSRGWGVQVSDPNAVSYILKFLRSKTFVSSKNLRSYEYLNKYTGDWTQETIAELQRRLAEMGYYDRAIDGAWGSSTSAAVTAFYHEEAK